MLMAGGSPKKPGAKKKKAVSDQHKQPQMPLVTVDVCLRCPQVCQRGVAYMDKMSKPGAIGFGVPCILRRK